MFATTFPLTVSVPIGSRVRVIFVSGRPLVAYSIRLHILALIGLISVAKLS